jgi:hypothetical protein
MSRAPVSQESARATPAAASSPVPKRKRSMEAEDTQGGLKVQHGALVPASTDAEAAAAEEEEQDDVRPAKRHQATHPVHAARLAAATLSLTATFPPILAHHHHPHLTTLATSTAVARPPPRRRRVQLVAGRRQVRHQPGLCIRTSL